MSRVKIVIGFIAVSLALGLLFTVLPAIADSPTVTEFPVCNNTFYQFSPAISGNIVVWEDYRNDNPDIYSYNMSSSTEFVVCNNSSEVWYPAVSGDIVVWMDGRSYTSTDIYGYNLSSSTEFPICTNSDMQEYPAISGNIVVWEDDRNGNGDIYGYNLSSSTEFIVCNNSSDQWYPAVSGDIVVWLDHRNGYYDEHEGFFNHDIYGKNLSSSTEFVVCNNSSEQWYPAVSGDIVVWEEDRNDDVTFTDIYGATLEWPTPTPTPSVSPTATVSPTVTPTVSPTPTPTATTEWWSIPYRTVGGQFVTVYSLLCTGPLTVNSSDFPYTEMTINFSKGNANGSYRDVVIDRDSFVSDTFNITLTGMSVPVTLSLSDDATGKLYVQGGTGDVDVFSNTTTEGPDFTLGDGTLDVAGSLLLDMPLVGDFEYPQQKILPMDTYMTTRYSFDIAIRPGCSIDNSIADGYGIPFMQAGGPSPYVGTDGTIIGALSLLDQRWIGVEWDFQFKLVMELEPMPNPGDVNNDGRINCIDITQTELCILYPETYPKENYPGWDANEDTTGPNAGDILAIEMRILGTW